MTTRYKITEECQITTKPDAPLTVFELFVQEDVAIDVHDEIFAWLELLSDGDDKHALNRWMVNLTRVPFGEIKQQWYRKTKEWLPSPPREYIHTIQVILRDEADAVMFRLRWSDYL